MVKSASLIVGYVEKRQFDAKSMFHAEQKFQLESSKKIKSGFCHFFLGIRKTFLFFIFSKIFFHQHVENRINVQ